MADSTELHIVLADVQATLLDVKTARASNEVACARVEAIEERLKAAIQRASVAGRETVVEDLTGVQVRQD